MSNPFFLNTNINNNLEKYELSNNSDDNSDNEENKKDENENQDDSKKTKVNGNPLNPVTGGEYRTYDVVAEELNKCIANINSYRILEYTSLKSLKNTKIKEETEKYKAMLFHYSGKLNEFETDYKKLSAEIKKKDFVGSKVKLYKYESKSDFEKRMKEAEKSNINLLSTMSATVNIKENFKDVCHDLGDWLEKFRHGNFTMQTLEEKRHSIENIDRLLSCDDIPENAKSFCLNQRKIIINEIKNTESSQNKNSDLLKKYNEAVEKYNSFKVSQDRTLEQCIKDDERAIELIDNILACENLPEQVIKIWQEGKDIYTRNLNRLKTKLATQIPVLSEEDKLRKIEQLEKEKIAIQSQTQKMNEYYKKEKKELINQYYKAQDVTEKTRLQEKIYALSNKYDKIMCKTSERIKFIDEELGNLKYR